MIFLTPFESGINSLWKHAITHKPHASGKADRGGSSMRQWGANPCASQIIPQAQTG